MNKTEPTQKHAPYPDGTVIAIENIAQEAVGSWLGGVRSGRVTKSSATGESGEAGVDVVVWFNGYLRGPFNPYVNESGVAYLRTISEENKVTVRVVLENAE